MGTGSGAPPRNDNTRLCFNENPFTTEKRYILSLIFNVGIPLFGRNDKICGFYFKKRSCDGFIDNLDIHVLNGFHFLGFIL